MTGWVSFGVGAVVTYLLHVYMRHVGRWRMPHLGGSIVSPDVPTDRALDALEKAVRSGVPEVTHTQMLKIVNGLYRQGYVVRHLGPLSLFRLLWDFRSWDAKARAAKKAQS